MNRRLLLVMLGKVLPVRATLLLLLTLLPLSSVKPFSSAETTSTPSPLPPKINTLQMVLSPEPFQWVLPVPELTEMMPSPVGKPQEKPVNLS